jgi:hypothetical protein
MLKRIPDNKINEDLIVVFLESTSTTGNGVARDGCMSHGEIDVIVASV